MRVDIVWGEGKGTTAVSAYDAALCQAGISDFNLIFLSSIIPPGAVLKEVGKFKGEGIGKVLPVVIAQSSGRGHQVAGLGWVQSPQGGLLMEAAGRRKEDVIRSINQGLKDMMERRSWDFSDISFRIQEADYPIGCALVAALFLIPRLQFLELFWTSPSTEGVHP